MTIERGFSARKTTHNIPEWLRTANGYLNPKDVAELFGCSIQTVGAMIKDGRLPKPKKQFIKSTSRLWSASTIRKLLAENKDSDQ